MIKPPQGPTRSFRPRRPPRPSVAPSATETPWCFSLSLDRLLFSTFPFQLLLQTPTARRHHTRAMSVTTNERANPPPRRKSCAACTRAKRRCDLAHPTCTRCAGRGLACHYPPRRGSPRSPLPSPHTPTLPVTPDFSIDELLDDFWARDVCAPDPLPLPDFGAPPAPTVELSPQGDGCGEAQPPGPIDMCNMVVMDAERQLVRIGGGMAGSGIGDRVECIPYFISERLKYVFDYLPETPKELVDTMGTPWCHPMVFEDQTPKAFEGNFPHPPHTRPLLESLTNDDRPHLLLRPLRLKKPHE